MADPSTSSFEWAVHAAASVAAHLSASERRVRVVLCEANERVQKKLEDAGLIATLGEGGYHETLADALAMVGPPPGH